MFGELQSVVFGDVFSHNWSEDLETAIYSEAVIVAVKLF